MFKDFLEKKLEDKGRQIEQRSKLDKEVVQLRFKGNQKQFEVNVELDAIFESIEIESESIEPNLWQIKKISQEGRQRIRKRRKLIKIADKSRDGRHVVAEYSRSRTSLHPAPKMKSVLRRQEKWRAARDVKSNKSLVIVERNQELLWALLISFFVVRKRASSLLVYSYV